VEKKSALDSAMNNPLLCDIRKSMLKGERHETCQRCWSTEDSGGSSLRQNWLTHFDLGLKEALLKTSEDGKLQEPKIRYLEITLGNTCNFKCRMCNPTFSSKWRTEYLHHGWMREDQFLPFKKTDWHSKTEFRNLFSGQVNNIEIINFIGGEPLISPTHIDLLKEIVEKKSAKNTVLSYSTNLSVVPREALQLWKEFKVVYIRASCDGFGDLYEYIRYPASWKVFQKNFIDLLEMRSEIPIQISLHSTLQVLNVTQMNQLLEWYFEISEKYNLSRIPYINYVENPEWYDPQIMPVGLKDIAISNLRGIFNRYEKLQMDPVGAPAAKDFFALMTRMMNSKMEKKSKILWQEFIKRNSQIDKYRNQKLLKVLPEFEEFLN
jgi:sulfatase maturation enzyme AslB (radical SAM superfamily)